MRLYRLFIRRFAVPVDGWRRVKLLEILGGFLPVEDPRHLAALRHSRRENGKSVRRGDFQERHQSPAEESEVTEIHPLASELPVLVEGPRGEAGAELCIHSAASGSSAKCAQLREDRRRKS